MDIFLLHRSQLIYATPFPYFQCIIVSHKLRPEKTPKTFAPWICFVQIIILRGNCYKLRVCSTHAQRKMYPAHGHIHYSVKTKSKSTILAKQERREWSEVKINKFLPAGILPLEWWLLQIHELQVECISFKSSFPELPANKEIKPMCTLVNWAEKQFLGPSMALL